MNIVVIEPTLDDQFGKFYLAPPAISTGGAHFTRLLYNVDGRPTPVFLHVPQCTSKQGCVRSGKRCYMDLVLSQTDTVFVQWIEHLETRCQELLFEKGTVWFDTALERGDIDAAFTTPLKIYRSGKYYLLRVNVPPEAAVFDENNQLLKADDLLSPTTPFVAILEVRGIKFSSAAFQMEFDLRQAMIVQPNPFLNTCFLKPSVMAAARPEPAQPTTASLLLPAPVPVAAANDDPPENDVSGEEIDVDLDAFIQDSVAALSAAPNNNPNAKKAEEDVEESDEVDMNALLPLSRPATDSQAFPIRTNAASTSSNNEEDMYEMDVDALLMDSTSTDDSNGGTIRLKLQGYDASAATKAAMAAAKAGRELYEQAKQAALEAVQIAHETMAKATTLCEKADWMRVQYGIQDNEPVRL